MKDVHIIKCGALYFFTTSLPPGSAPELIAHSSPNVTTTLIVPPDSNDYFVLLVAAQPHVAAKYDAEFVAASIKNAVSHTWSQLWARGVVDTEEMPEWIEGNPLDMLPTPAYPTAQANVM